MRLSSPVNIKVVLQSVHPGALKWRLTAIRSAQAWERDTDAGPMLVEERATLLTQLFVRRVLLTNGGEESHSALVRQEVQEPHEFPMQAAGGGRDQRQESIVFVLVVETVLRYRTLGSVDAHAVGVLSMPRRAMATDRRRRGISWTESSKNKKAPVIMNRILQDSGNARILRDTCNARILRHLQCPNPPTLAMPESSEPFAMPESSGGFGHCKRLHLGSSEPCQRRSHPGPRGHRVVSRGWRRRSGAWCEGPQLEGSPPPRLRGARVPHTSCRCAGCKCASDLRQL